LGCFELMAAVTAAGFTVKAVRPCRVPFGCFTLAPLAAVVMAAVSMPEVDEPFTAKTRSRTVGGFWGLAQLPLFGNLFKQTSKDDESDNVLIAIRPVLLSLPPDQVPTRAVRVGTETRPYTPL